MPNQTSLSIIFLLSLVSCANNERLRSHATTDETTKSTACTGVAPGDSRSDAAYMDLQYAASSLPDDKTLLVRLARKSFESKNYGQAIVYADAARKQDPTNRELISIAAVSALRVSSKALGELKLGLGREKSKVSEAKALANLLRATLGEEKLVPDVPGHQPP